VFLRRVAVSPGPELGPSDLIQITGPESIKWDPTGFKRV